MTACGDDAVKKNPIEFEVKNGWGASIVTRKLHESQLITSKTTFRAFLLLSGKSGCIKAGKYQISQDHSYFKIAEILCSGQSVTVNMTIPEGYNNRQLGDLLVKHGFAESREEFLDLAKNKKLLTKYSIKAETLEGYLFPETYNLPVDYSLEQVVEVFLKKMQQVLKEEVGTELSGVKLHEKMILASIVEREAQRKEERAIIAGVFQNRLDQSIPLESCATVQYLFEKPKKRLFYRDLEIESPYNTYIYSGLPPGPISNPGLAALKASFKPMDTSYLYFVLKGDGYHHFSETFQEHVKAKKKYIGP